jgi:hypothetical protein
MATEVFVVIYGLIYQEGIILKMCFLAGSSRPSNALHLCTLIPSQTLNRHITKNPFSNITGHIVSSICFDNHYQFAPMEWNPDPTDSICWKILWFRWISCSMRTFQDIYVLTLICPKSIPPPNVSKLSPLPLLPRIKQKRTKQWQLSWKPSHHPFDAAASGAFFQLLICCQVCFRSPC